MLKQQYKQSKRSSSIFSAQDQQKSSIQWARLNATESGFTLIELMVVVAIVGIIAAIAVPSYRSQVIQNAEHQAQKRALFIANELSRWRSKNLSYINFEPSNECPNGDTFCYSATTNGGIVNVPLGSSQVGRRYSITLVDANSISGGSAKTSLVALNATTGVSGKGWRMLVEPNTDKLESAHSYYLDSLGQRCQYIQGSTLPDLKAASISCTGAGVTTW